MTVVLSNKNQGLRITKKLNGESDKSKRQKMKPSVNKKIAGEIKKSCGEEVDSDEKEQVAAEGTPLELATPEFNLNMNTKTSKNE